MHISHEQDALNFDSLLGRSIKHLWVEEGKETWFEGTVKRVGETYIQFKFSGGGSDKLTRVTRRNLRRDFEQGHFVISD